MYDVHHSRTTLHPHPACAGRLMLASGSPESIQCYSGPLRHFASRHGHTKTRTDPVGSRRRGRREKYWRYREDCTRIGLQDRIHESGSHPLTIHILERCGHHRVCQKFHCGRGQVWLPCPRSLRLHLLVATRSLGMAASRGGCCSIAGFSFRFRLAAAASGGPRGV